MGPVLFLVYVNDISDINVSEGSLLLYVDNVLLYHPIRCPDDFIYLQQDIDKLYAWSQRNILQFNPTKCKYMIVSRKRLPFLTSAELNIDNIAMSRVDHFNYLGVWLSHNLSWNKHMEVTCKSATKKLDLIFRKFYKHSPPATLKQFYRSYVLSLIHI